MTWYRTGTVALVSGQTAITGTGTQWLTKTKAGDALLGPDGKLYELLGVTSDTQATLATPYAGASAPATPYVIVPTQSITRLLSSQVGELIALYAAVPESIAEATVSAVATATAAAQEAAAAAAAASGRIVSVDKRDAKPVDAPPAHVGAFFASREGLAGGAGVSYVDMLVLNGYMDASGGLVNGLALSKVGTGIYHYQGGVGSAAWNAPRQLAYTDSPAFTGAVTGITKAMVGLSNVDNTTDANKPVSTAQATALALKEPTIAAGSTAQFWRGDKTWQALNKAAVGLGNVDNTSDANKPVSTAQASAVALRYGKNNILGIVSHAAGVPTGAVIERGSNANGQYVRFADGTMICTNITDVLGAASTHGAIFSNPSTVWSFPSSFVGGSVPFTTASEVGGNGSTWCGLGTGAASAASATYQLFRAIAATISSQVALLAVGRWF